jgi:hypothetical protein
VGANIAENSEMDASNTRWDHEIGMPESTRASSCHAHRSQGSSAIDSIKRRVLSPDPETFRNPVMFSGAISLDESRR